MQTFFFFGTYSSESIREVNRERTGLAVGTFEEHNGHIKSMHAVMGPYDLVILATLPGNKDAMEVSLKLSQRLGIRFCTCPALSVEHFDAGISGTKTKVATKAV